MFEYSCALVDASVCRVDESDVDSWVVPAESTWCCCEAVSIECDLVLACLVLVVGVAAEICIALALWAGSHAFGGSVLSVLLASTNTALV